MKKISILLVIIVLTGSCSIFRKADPAEERAGREYPIGITLADRVIIKRTHYGVPHIYADDMEAAGFALGYLQAEDYGARVPEVLLKARGEWAKYNDLEGERLSRAIDSDASARRNWQRAVETWQLLEQDARDMLDGFASGINWYITLHPGEFPDWAKPHYTGYDAHARSISRPDNAAVRRFLTAHARRQDTVLSSIAGNILARLAMETEDPDPEEGSNAWALGPERTVSGKAILMRNPHLAWDAGYYEAHMIVPGKFNFYGDFRIGHALGIIGGFNERLGWATTNNSPDLEEIYSFDVDPLRPGNILIDGTSVSLVREKIEVEYKAGETTGKDTREFLSTPYGPVILEENGKIFIVRSAGDGEFRSGEQFLKMMKARNFVEWEEAVKMRAKVNSNLTYADADGNIYYVWNASIPLRPHGATGDTVAVHVTSPDQMWQDFVQWEDIPRLLNPPGGYVRNENDTYHVTNLNQVLRPEDYPDYFPEPQLRLRSQHSLGLLHNSRRFTLEEVVELKHSMKMLMADRVKDDLIKAVEATNPVGEIAPALEVIRSWDNTVAVDSRGGILFETWWNRYVSTADSVNVTASPASAGYSATATRLYREPWTFDRPAETPRGLADPERAAADFTWAVNETVRRYGRFDPAWGDIHRAVIGDVDVPVGGGSGTIGCFRVLTFSRHNSDSGKLKADSGDGWILAVEFDDIPKAYSVLAYGQSSRPGSPWYNDQLAMFAANSLKRVAYTDEDVERDKIFEYRPGYRLKKK
jgi:acyl-homoserine-lactone acylase